MWENSAFLRQSIAEKAGEKLLTINVINKDAGVDAPFRDTSFLSIQQTYTVFTYCAFSRKTSEMSQKQIDQLIFFN